MSSDHYPLASRSGDHEDLGVGVPFSDFVNDVLAHNAAILGVDEPVSLLFLQSQPLVEASPRSCCHPVQLELLLADVLHEDIAACQTQVIGIVLCELE